MKRILIIEDNDDIRNNTAEILELANYEVATAENGIKGVASALEFLPDLILCDIMMPELDGYGVLHALQKNPKLKNTPFIFLTALTERGDFRKGMEMGADDYITKPFSGIELLTAVEGRLKKMDLFRADLEPGIEGVQYLIENAACKDHLKVLADDSNVNRYDKNQPIYFEGNYPNRLFYLISGKVKSFKSNGFGKELVTELFSPGDFFGYVAMIEGTAYKDSASTLEDCEIATISKEDFDKLISTNREVAQKFIRLLAKNVSNKEEQLINIAYNSLRKKVADALLTLHKRYYADTTGPATMVISRGSLATIAGTAKESLIRTLGDFRDEKLIEIARDGGIKILNLPKLESMLN